jgi:hypothetical protein
VAKIPANVSERKKVRTSIKLAGSAQTQESTPIVRGVRVCCVCVCVFHRDLHKHLRYLVQST